jgi:hypothetical protein
MFAPSVRGPKTTGEAHQTISLTKPLEKISEKTSPQKEKS